MLIGPYGSVLCCYQKEFIIIIISSSSSRRSIFNIFGCIKVFFTEKFISFKNTKTMSILSGYNYYFYSLRVFHATCNRWAFYESLSDRKSTLLSRTLPSIWANLCNAIVLNSCMKKTAACQQGTVQAIDNVVMASNMFGWSSLISQVNMEIVLTVITLPDLVTTLHIYYVSC